jgi:hypothetical protein
MPAVRAIVPPTGARCRAQGILQSAPCMKKPARGGSRFTQRRLKTIPFVNAHKIRSAGLCDRHIAFHEVTS